VFGVELVLALVDLVDDVQFEIAQHLASLAAQAHGSEGGVVAAHGASLAIVREIVVNA